jgi:hypothetical protein
MQFNTGGRWPKDACGFCSQGNGSYVFHGFPCTSRAAQAHKFEQLTGSEKLKELHRKIDELQDEIRRLSLPRSSQG